MKRITSFAITLCLIAIVVLAQAPIQPPKPGPEHKKLEAFLGTWTYEGEAKESVVGPAGKISGTDVYEMLPGGFFLQHHWDEKNPLGNVKGTEIWGYDPIRKTYTYNFFSSLGEMGSGTFKIKGDTWTFAGTGVTYDGKRARGRGTVTFAGPTSFNIKGEASSDGKTWTPSFEGKWTKSR
jgi:hypothetical protein